MAITGLSLEPRVFGGSGQLYKPCYQSSGQPCVPYSDSVNSKKATLMKFDGTNWTSVGNVGFSAGGALYTSVAFSPPGEPYVAYVDNGTAARPPY